MDLGSGHVLVSNTGNGGGVFRSVDGGSTWAKFEGDLSQIRYPTSTRMLFRAPNGDLFAGGNTTYGMFAGLARSSDGGSTWTRSDDGMSNRPTMSTMAVDAAGTYWAGTALGLYRSTDGGSTWTDAKRGVIGTGPQTLVFNASGDLFTGSGCGVHRSTDGGSTWTELDNGFYGRTVNALAVGSNGLVVAADYSNPDFYRSTDNGDSWTHRAAPFGWGSGFVGLEFVGGNLLACTANGVWRSTDLGDSWTKSSHGLPAGEWVYPIVRQPDGDLFVAVLGAGIYRSSNSGASWTIVDPTFLSTSQWLLRSTPEGVLFAVPNPDSRLFRSVDDGATWTAVTNYSTRSLVGTPDGILYRSGGFGMSRSTDGGTTWTEYDEGMEYLRVHALAVSPAGDVYAGTGGGGVWRLVLK